VSARHNRPFVERLRKIAEMVQGLVAAKRESLGLG
jgi:hypothetical protein